MTEVEFETLKTKNKDEFDIIDIRPQDSFNCGHIPGSINIPLTELFEKTQKFNKSKEYIICCKNGTTSLEIAEKLSLEGVKTASLKGGYLGYLKTHFEDFDGRNLREKAEKSIQKTFRKDILTKFIKAIKTYDLISAGDKIAVCISGGKDSFLMAKLFQELLKFTDIPFLAEYVVMDPGYSPENLELIKNNAKILGIPIHIFNSNIFDSVFNIEKSPCYICARMRRGYLYNEAKKLGCNKIALGHHFDDVIETILMGMLFGAQIQTMMPKIKSDNFDEVELIRPMYLIREADIIRWRNYNDLHFLQCACKFTSNCTDEGCNRTQNTGSKRSQTKKIIAKIKETDPQIEQNIFKSVENVNLSTIIAYKDFDGNKHNFRENYEKIKQHKKDNK